MSFALKRPAAIAPEAISPRERFLESVFASATDYAIIALDTVGLVTSWNEGACRILGWTEAEMIGRPASTFFTEGDCREGTPQREMIAALDHGRGIDERWHLRKDGTVFWANGEMMALRDEAGLHLGFVKILRDRTAQRGAAEKNRSDAEFLHGVLASSQDCIKILDLEGKLTFMTERGRQIMEVSDFNQIRGCPWPDFWEGIGNADALQAIATARAGGVGQFVGQASTMNKVRKWWDVVVSPILGHDGRPERLLCVSRDVTETREAQDHARMMSEELQHRVQNTLAMVQAVVRQTLRNSDGLETAQEAIELRLAALGRAHGMLTAGGWVGSDLRRIIGTALDLHGDHADRFIIRGPKVFLDAQAATSFALLLHELGTNATKYGALSVPEGRVEIIWTATPGHDRASQRLDLTWTERGGPPVAPPTRRGFGSRLIEKALASALKGKAAINFLNEGVVCRVTGLVETPTG